jgi:hypothetical protein
MFAFGSCSLAISCQLSAFSQCNIKILLPFVIPNRRVGGGEEHAVGPYKKISHNPMVWACAKTTFSRERLQSEDSDVGEPGFPLGYTYAWVELQ